MWWWIGGYIAIAVLTAGWMQYRDRTDGRATSDTNFNMFVGVIWPLFLVLLALVAGILAGDRIGIKAKARTDAKPTE